MAHGGARRGAGRPRKEVVEKASTANKTVEELAQQYSPEAIRILRKIARMPDTPPSARVAACNSIIDRACGRPNQTATVTNVTKHAPTDWERDELVRFLNDAPKSGNGAAAPGHSDDEPGSVH